MDALKKTAWCLYDFGLSAFPVIVITFVFSTYFTSKIAPNVIEGTAQWGKAIAISGIVIAILSPIIGAIARYHGKRKNWLGFFTIVAIIATALLWYAYPTSDRLAYTLTCVAVGVIGVSLAMVFYNAMLTTLVPLKTVGKLSGLGWGLGYFGGLCALFIIYFGFVEAKPSWLSQATFAQIRICGPLVAVWFAIFAIPLFWFIPESHFASEKLPLNRAIKIGLSDVWQTLKKLRHDHNLLFFLIAQMFYMDALNTIFAFVGVYATGVFHFTLQTVLIYGIVMNIFAGAGSIGLGWLDDLMGVKKAIMLFLCLLIISLIGVVLTNNTTLFWILSACGCLFIGPVQSSSRSLMTHLVTKENATELFGFYILSGKITTFLGPALLATMTAYFHSQRIGMGSVFIFFIIGAILLSRVVISKEVS